jgi:ABC-2 type transport system permease protein
MVAYLSFELRRQARNWTPPLFAVLMPVLLYVLLMGTDSDSSSVLVEGVSIPDVAYVMIALAAFGAVMGVLSLASGVSEERHSGWLRQLRATPLPHSRVLLAKGVVSTLIAILVTVAVGATAVILQDLSLPIGRWPVIVAVMWLGAAPFALLGLAFGYALRPQQAYPATMLTWLGLAALGGWMTSIDSFPGWLQQVSRVTPGYRYSELGWRAVEGAAPTVAGVAILAAWTVALGLVATWTYRRFAAVT